MGISNAILRSVPGAYILQSGYGKLSLDAASAEGLKQFAATGIPQFAEWDSEVFGKFIAGSELLVGGLLVTPFVSKRLAGAALLTFSAGMLTMYFRNPGMTQEDGIRPSQEGTGLSKDVFMAAIGAALMIQK